jgi:hypothetical protein
LQNTKIKIKICFVSNSAPRYQNQGQKFLYCCSFETERSCFEEQLLKLEGKILRDAPFKKRIYLVVEEQLLKLEGKILRDAPFEKRIYLVVEEQLLKLEGKILRDAPFKKRRSGG